LSSLDAAYADGPAWAAGPQVIYDRLAAAALGNLPAILAGLRAVDVGAGTGAATRELLRRGATVLAVDRSPAMLAELTRQTRGKVPTMIGDIRRLAINDDTYDVAVAAFVINHLADPGAGVKELCRITRAGGRVVATTFGVDDHLIKAAVDEVLVRHGFVHPEWYRTVKDERMPLTATPAALATVGERAGLRDVIVREIDVDLGDLRVTDAIGYRLGLSHIAPYVAALEPLHRTRLDAELLEAVKPLPPLRLPMLVLSGLR
jgi:SAM-dependent methyltransferase